jgi:glycosyltransferase involved in cell wall biosynthesis
MKLALHIIAKDQVEQVRDIIKLYHKHFDEIAIAGDMRHDEFGALTGSYHGGERDCVVSYFQYVWKDDFADKRNFLVSKTKSDYYIRLDTDDEILNPEAIRGVFSRAVEHRIDCIYCPYHYSADQDGNLNAVHWRETLIRKSDKFYWKKKVHENIFIEEPKSFKGVKENSIAIKHNITVEHVEESNIRNLKILLKEFNEDKENCDIRTIAYIGRSFLGMGLYDRAALFLQLLVEKTGWDDDRYFGLVHLAEAYHRLGDKKKAISNALTALAEKPHWPDAYFKLGQIHLDNGKYKEAVEWLSGGLLRKQPDTMIVVDPTQYTYVPLFNLAMSHLGVGDVEKACRCYEEALKIAPTNPTLKKAGELFTDARESAELFKSFRVLERHLAKEEPALLPALPSIITKKMMRDHRYYTLKHRYSTPKTWPDKSVVMFCGGAYEDWADPSVITGIGGSEEAVIYMSRELTKLGYKVTVFNQCGNLAGTYRGVDYKPFYEFNPNDTYDTLIMWRGIPGNIKANRRFLWLHDVPMEGTINKDNVDCFDKVFVLSDFHKSLLPAVIPAEKVIVSANGINIQDFNLSTDRNPHKVVYTSSYDRGLEHLLKMWPDVRREVPDAELHIFYGWNTYDRMVDMGMRDGRFKQAMVPLMKQDGVFEHGRVGHKQLNKEMSSAGIWAYPSHFEEISCISAMKAQACGAVPVTTDYAALAETNKYGIKIPGKAGEGDTNELFRQVLVGLLKEGQEEKRKVMLERKGEWSWGGVAKQWSALMS